MRLTILGSGSKGNALVVDAGSARIAVDAGFGVRTLAQRMRAEGIKPQSVTHCAITHEHIDHIRGARRVQEKWNWTLASTAPTLRAIGVTPGPRAIALRHDEAMMIGDVRLTLLAISHDAVSPSAVLIECTRTGRRVGIAYDLGEVPERLAASFAGLDILVLEANHDYGMLRSGNYPPMLKDRIASPRGHLSNAQAAAFAKRVVHPGMRALVLAHLSEENNTPKIARAALARALQGTEFRGKLVPAPQNTTLAVGDRATEQLSLL